MKAIVTYRRGDMFHTDTIELTGDETNNVRILTNVWMSKEYDGIVFSERGKDFFYKKKDICYWSLVREDSEQEG